MGNGSPYLTGGTFSFIGPEVSMIVHGNLCTVLAVLVRASTLRGRETACWLARLPKDWSERQNL